MSRALQMLGGPSELQNAIEDGFSYTALPPSGVFKLLCLGHEGHGDYTWGFRIYRTTYKRPDSDSRFAKAIEVLNEYVRYECFSFDNTGEPKEASHPDSKASEQLWQRLRHDVIEDRELLEGASEHPDKILKLAQDWVHLDRKATTGDSPRYRFFLVIDDEVIDQLLQLPMPARVTLNVPALYSVKVFDARFNSPPEFSGGESDSDSEADSEADSEGEEFHEDFEGYFWSPARRLADLWFGGHDLPWEELLHWDDSWDGKSRFVPSKAALGFPLPMK
jgi:hypothetical protein